MKTFCCFIAIALFCGCTALAGASPIDFSMHVLDGPGPLVSYPVNEVNTTNFTFGFIPCVSGELTDGSMPDGCFAGINDTGATITSLAITVDNSGSVLGQPVGCSSTSVLNTLLPTSTCDLDTTSNEYLLNFSGDPGIGSGVSFFITEDGVTDLADFPDPVVTATLTPEPPSALLVSTGFALLLGFMFATKRGRELRESLVSSC